MKVLIGIIVFLGIAATGLYAETKSQEADLAEKAAKIEQLELQADLKQLSLDALETTLQTVRAELEEIQALSDEYAVRSAYLNEQLTIQGRILKVTKQDNATYQEALRNILQVNEAHKKCIVQNLAQGTLTSDGTRTVVAGQSTCFFEYKSSVTEIAALYGADKDV